MLSMIALSSFTDVTNAQQIQDTLHEVKVIGKQDKTNDIRINGFAPGQKIKTIDSTTLQQYRLQNIASLLSQQVPVFVKSYGFNGLATLNFRGASAAQSQVLWNGVPIQNAALGIADVSTLPVLFADKVSVIYGSSGALLGSGNVGGALLIENTLPVFDTARTTCAVTAAMGSFGQYLGGLNGSITRHRWYFSANLFAQTAQNDFKYTDETGKEKTLQNSHLKSGAILARAAYKIAERNIISLSAWYQQYNRQIPPALFEQASVKQQVDGSLRLLLDWKKENDKSTWYAKGAFTRDYLHYSDSAASIISDNVSYQYYQEVGWKRLISQHSNLLIFAPVQLSWIDIEDSNKIKQQSRVALAAAYDISFFQSRLNIAVNARGEVIDQQSIFLPGVDASYKLTRWLNLRANVQRTYRVPTLNELYYVPGGNPSLKPEQGWNEDAGYIAKIKWGNFSVYHDLSVYNRLINNWVIWLGGAIWTPHNIAAVNSRGVETENNIVWERGNWKIHLGINTSYVVATTQSSYQPNDNSVGKQIPYTPLYNGQLNFGFSYKRLYINYNHTYTGYRYITSDESEYLTPYQTGNMQVMYNSFLLRHAIQVIGQCNNLWNQTYQVVAYRPMPGINALIGIKYNFLDK